MSGLTKAFALELFEAALLEAGYRQTTIRGKRSYLAVLYEYLRDKGIEDLREVDRACMLGFCQYLAAYRGVRTRKPLRLSTRRGIVGVAKLLFRCLYERGLILSQPMSGIQLMRPGETPSRVHLSEDEVARFLDGIDTDASFGLRDRALYELIYSSGLRASEASGLNVGEVDVEKRLIQVRQGKYSKDRVVPITEVAAQWIAPLVHARAPEQPVFRGAKGKRVSSASINHRFKALLEREGLYREGLTVHELRHACATHLLAHGADIRYVQGLLGHKSVQTTVRYTNELVENLRRRYLRGHPRENESRRAVDEAYTRGFAALMGRLERAKKKRERRANRATPTGSNSV